MIACPGCQRPMRAVELPTSAAACEAAHACPYCSGVLLLADALQRAAARPLSFEADPSEERRACPKCAVTMSTEKIEDVVVDRCAGCRRVFLDAGELEHLARRPLFPRKPRALAADYAAAEQDFLKARARNAEPARVPRRLFGVRRGAWFDFNE